jgi:hypothetical protein
MPGAPTGASRTVCNRSSIPPTVRTRAASARVMLRQEPFALMGIRATRINSGWDHPQYAPTHRAASCDFPSVTPRFRFRCTRDPNLSWIVSHQSHDLCCWSHLSKSAVP